jgi:ABC-2 type transport system permease protein
VRKETRQVVRDPSSIAIGVVLPLILILLFGYGLSLDVKNVPLAVVIEYPARRGDRARGRLQLSPYFKPQMLRSMPPAQQAAARASRSTASCAFRRFLRQLAAGDADVQLIVHGGDANRARIIEGYVQGALARGRRGWRHRDRAREQCRSMCRRACGSTKPMTAAISWCPA